MIVHNATLPDGQTGVDILISDGLIQAVGPNIQATALEEIDADGRLVSPPLIDCHFHMDATLSLGLPRLNRSGTLLEGIALWNELKPLLTQEALLERGLRYCDMAVAQGIGAIRTHVDVCDDRLVGVEAMVELRARVSSYLTLQLVAFPQDGLYRSPTAMQNLMRALDLGVDVIGGIPHFERTMEDGRRSVTEMCELGANLGRMVDLHCDESDDPLSRHVEQFAYETQRLGLGGRVTGSHLTSMHSMDNYYASKLIALIAESGMAAISNPLINITLQGRHDTYPRRRGLTRVPELQAAGVPVAFGQDCVMDPWYSMGSGDMLEVAHMGVHAVPMTSMDQIRSAFDAVTSVPASIMNLEGYGLTPGCKADLIVLDAADPVEAVRIKPPRLHVIRGGKVLARSAPRTSSLNVPGRPGMVTFGRGISPA
ncbi:MAG TPA: amidohydrolase family protein [Geminicoccus sp.]|uniref:amidohydrolase family protein n=1 Tax=Geminicoccus sp. TaxID=2024832 RepID=UPI002E33248A|nr:amidohydrolase family protein [Geminicoccus sp.]HEX2527839.1 amidohydrolase family protein [Geminicoccus sp.]